MREKFDIVVACDQKFGIGKNNSLPWRLSQDLKYFKELTLSRPPVEDEVPKRSNAVIMGRKTWESIPAQYRPLAGRFNVVLTRNLNYQLPQGVFKAPSLDDALNLLSKGPVDRVFVIGGAEVYKEALIHDRCGLLYVTEVRAVFECDTFLPDFKPFFQLMSCSEVVTENNIDFCFKVYEFSLADHIIYKEAALDGEESLL
ncbi:MAG: dihydrofolate reductase [Candidatus Obscuribacter sp.]|nr:dihydrofolate reductase [Candidatus Obscuribacter sp.]MDQ5964485.1 Dihydrofolate reductase [Cyanobacteriota bacterium erpe_2018_sw_39hr_WHONDRS-SW48-000098_B_bin.30]MBK7837039.1 dihydrofolate reductase [Candidatus Obscuribacter sp.]MBK9203724.1 dihydrofolate reductase [Candidatus Obscuribacter sp.]MBK9620374.1 dihydrofolate reductase [Candidatus Obscuribacter sp.]